MRVLLTNQRKEALRFFCQTLKQSKANQRYTATITGYITSSLPGVKYEGFHHKHLQKDKVNALKNSKAYLMQKFSFYK